MKIFAACMQCLIELEHPSFEPIFVDYYDDGIAHVKCSAGHKTAQIIQSSKFEILMESGATALLEGFTFEACASFSVALERFYEFGIEVMSIAHGVTADIYNLTFKEMSRQSERQLGAFMLLYAIEFKEPYLRKEENFSEKRNTLIHKGKIPTKEEAAQFASDVYNEIFKLYKKFLINHRLHINEVMIRRIRQATEKLPQDMRAVTNSGPWFFNISKIEIEPDFHKALNTFKEARAALTQSVPGMEKLHEQIPKPI